MRRSLVALAPILLVSACGAEAPPPVPPPPPVIQMPVATITAPPPQPVTAPTWNLYAFRREVKKGKEAGLLDYDLPITDPAGITSSWQPIDGGLIYLSADRKLHMLLGRKN